MGKRKVPNRCRGTHLWNEKKPAFGFRLAAKARQKTCFKAKLHTATTQELTSRLSQYVYAFLLKFTELHSTTSQPTLLQNVKSLEDALVESSPPSSSALPTTRGIKPRTLPVSGGSSPLSALSSSPSSLSSASRSPSPAPIFRNPDHSFESSSTTLDLSPPIPETSELLIEIFKAFKANLPEAPDSHQRKDWFGWLFRFVKNRMIEKENGIVSLGLEWTVNLLKRPGTRALMDVEKEFWLLSWENKIHIMRVLVDYQLTYSHVIRSVIDECYDLGKQRIIKRSSDLNRLTIDPIGPYQKSRRTLWSLDNTARLYSSEGPHSRNPFWTTVAIDAVSYESLCCTLVEPKEEVVAEEPLAGPFKKAKVDAAKAKEKGKKERDGDEIKKEMATRKKLQETLPIIVAAEERAAQEIINAEIKRQKALDRAAGKDARVARQLSKIDYGMMHPRERRTRTAASRRVDYVYDAEDDSDEDDEEEEDYDERDGKSETGSRRNGSGKGKRSESAGTVEGEPSAKKARESAVVQEWRGERRSSRIQLKGDDEEEGGNPEKEMTDASADAPAPLEASTSSVGADGPNGLKINLSVAAAPSPIAAPVVDANGSSSIAPSHAGGPSTTASLNSSPRTTEGDATAVEEGTAEEAKAQKALESELFPEEKKETGIEVNGGGAMEVDTGGA
ncbi:hypothetical protein P7C70_g1980, partial [Phenoliferia sp. Uapishka_3]